MKWPAYLAMIRHDVSAYNVLKAKKLNDPLYQEFKESFDHDPFSSRTKNLAGAVWEKFRLGIGDHNTPLIDPDSARAEKVGSELKTELDLPDIIFVSPYERTLGTFAGLKRGWPELENVPFLEEERIREQGHGLSLIYNDWRIFFALNPEQKMLHDMEGPYWYRYPQGENVPDMRSRNRSFHITLTRDFCEKKVLVISHHLNILATRANLERWGDEQFVHVDENEKPINCGVTLYEGNPALGENGRFVLRYYNKKFF